MWLQVAVNLLVVSFFRYCVHRWQHANEFAAEKTGIRNSPSESQVDLTPADSAANEFPGFAAI